MQLDAGGDQSMASGKQNKKRPQSKMMAPFPNTVKNADSINDNTFDQI
jgi:hypothetical protein